jgi:hypothetical protein
MLEYTQLPLLFLINLEKKIHNQFILKYATQINLYQ